MVMTYGHMPDQAALLMLSVVPGVFLYLTSQGKGVVVKVSAAAAEVTPPKASKSLVKGSPQNQEQALNFPFKAEMFHTNFLLPKTFLLKWQNVIASMLPGLSVEYTPYNPGTHASQGLQLQPQKQCTESAFKSSAETTIWDDLLHSMLYRLRKSLSLHSFTPLLKGDRLGMGWQRSVHKPNFCC